jgi:hypothetical protein
MQHCHQHVTGNNSAQSDSLPQYPSKHCSFAHEPLPTPTPLSSLSTAQQSKIQPPVAVSAVQEQKSVNSDKCAISKGNGSSTSKKRIGIACTNCRASHKKCSEERPCLTCVSLGIGHLCRNSPATTSKRGPKREKNRLLPRSNQAPPQFQYCQERNIPMHYHPYQHSHPVDFPPQPAPMPVPNGKILHNMTEVRYRPTNLIPAPKMGSYNESNEEKALKLAPIRNYMYKDSPERIGNSPKPIPLIPPFQLEMNLPSFGKIWQRLD